MSLSSKSFTNEPVYQSTQANEYNVIRVHETKVGTRWIESSCETDTFTQEQKDRFLSKETLSWFRNLGGRETVKQGRFKGIVATINVSLSPDRKERKTTYFLF